MTSIAVDTVVNRPKVCAFYAGRVWYAGVPSPSKSGWVLFSQVASNKSLLSRCYQANDPTSEVFSDILDSDGGLIPIPDAGEIVSLQPLGNVLLVFATQGVWSIRGGDNGFKATEYSVDKITSSGCLTTKSVVVAEEVLMYWSAHGIYALKVAQTDIVQVENVSDATIKTYYSSIPLVCKLHVVGTYNETEKVVYWSFCSDSSLFSTYGQHFKNTLLKLDLRLKAFYIETLPPSISHAVKTIAVTKETFEEEQDFEVVVDADEIVVGTDEVLASIGVIDSASKQTKFFYTTSDEYYIADYKTEREDFLDFGLTEKPAYLITGWNMGGVGPARQKTALYLTVFAKRTEEVVDADFDPQKQSSIKMQTRWNFTDSSGTNKWSDEYEVYRQLRPYFLSSPGSIEDGYPLVITKNKIRGRGKALQIKWSAGTNKDMKLVGWTTTYIGNSSV